MIGLPDMLPLSFRKAITSPEKVIAPIATPRPISIRLLTWIRPVAASVMPKASGLRKAAAPTATAARPTRLWNAATSCGIAVIAIRCAMTMPITAPMADRRGDLQDEARYRARPDRSGRGMCGA